MYFRGQVFIFDILFIDETRDPRLCIEIPMRNKTVALREKKVKSKDLTL